MKTEVFVLSAGYAPEHDYRWKAEGSENHDLSVDLRERFNWLDDIHPSLLVERVNPESFRVLVAGFSTERRDYRGGALRNAILWQNLPSGSARSLALDFLRARDGFNARCNAAIASKDDAPGGYKVDWQALRAIAATITPAPSRAAEALCMEKPLTETKNTADLIAESDWPAAPQVLLVITHLPSSSALRKLRELPVWRFHHEQAITQDLPPKAMPRSKPGLTTTDNESKTILKVCGIALAALLTIGAIAWLKRIITPETTPEKNEAPVNSGGQFPAPTPAAVVTPTPSAQPSQRPN